MNPMRATHHSFFPYSKDQFKDIRLEGSILAFTGVLFLTVSLGILIYSWTLG